VPPCGRSRPNPSPVCFDFPSRSGFYRDVGLTCLVLRTRLGFTAWVLCDPVQSSHEIGIRMALGAQRTDVPARYSARTEHRRHRSRRWSRCAFAAARWCGTFLSGSALPIADVWVVPVDRFRALLPVGCPRGEPRESTHLWRCGRIGVCDAINSAGLPFWGAGAGRKRRSRPLLWLTLGAGIARIPRFFGCERRYCWSLALQGSGKLVFVW